MLMVCLLLSLKFDMYALSTQLPFSKGYYLSQKVLKCPRFVVCLFVFLFFSVIEVGLHFNESFMGLIRWLFMLWKSQWIQTLLIKRDIVILYTDQKLGHFQYKTHWFQMHFRFQNVKNEIDIQCCSILWKSIYIFF